MAEKKIEVVIDGKEFVTTAAGKAEGSLDGFMSKIPGWAKVTGLLTAAFAVVSKVVGEVGDFVMDSISAYDAYAAAQVKLSATSKLTGVSLDELKRVTKTAREEFGLSSVSAVELTSSVARFTTAAGATSKASGLMASALELGAASGLNATQVAEGLTSALAGNDEFLNKLGLSNPSVIWEKYRVANGLAKDQMDDTTKALAVMTEIMNAGSVVAGGYAERLESGAGQQEKLNNRMDEAKVAFGAAIQPLRVFTVQGLTVLVDVLGRVGLAVARVVNAVGVILVGAFQIARGVVGGLVEGLGKLTGNKELEEWGKKQTQAFPTFIDQLKKMEQGIDATGTATTKAGTKLKENTKLTEEELKKQDAEWKAYLKEYEAHYKRMNALYADYLKSLEKLQPAMQKAFDTQHIEGQNRALKASKEAADAAFDAIRDKAGPLPPLVQSLGDRVKDMGDELGISARATLDLGQAFGIIDDEAASTLTSVINLAEEIGKIFDAKKGGKSIDFSSMVSIVASAAQILQSVFTKLIFGDDARRKLIEDNTRELSRLRNELGNLSLNVSGDDFASMRSALGEVLPQLRGGRGAANQADVINALARRGLGMGDLKKLADQLGIKIFSESGALSVDGLKQLFEAMGLVELGQFGQDFSSQKQSTETGFGVNKTDDLGQIGALGNLGGRFSSALAGVVDVNDLAGTRERLKGLFERMQTGGLSAADLGGLTGTQFLDLITDIIGRIDNLSTSTGGGSTGTGSAGSSGTGGAAGSTGGTVTSGGTVVPTKTLADVLDGVVAQTTALGTYHTEHLNIATAHLNEARTQTAILLDIADNTRGFKSGSVVDVLDVGLEQMRNSEAAERGLGASY